MDAEAREHDPRSGASGSALHEERCHGLCAIESLGLRDILVNTLPNLVADFLSELHLLSEFTLRSSMLCRFTISFPDAALIAVVVHAVSDSLPVGALGKYGVSSGLEGTEEIHFGAALIAA